MLNPLCLGNVGVAQEYKIRVTHRLNLCVGYLTQARPGNVVMVGNDGARGIAQLVVHIYSLPEIVRSFLVRAGTESQGYRSQRRIGWSGSCMSPAMPESVKMV